MTDIPIATSSPSEADPVSEGRVGALEERVHRLEDAVAAIQDTRRLEERIVERVSSRVQLSAAPAEREMNGTIIESGRKLLPAALRVIRGDGKYADGPPGFRRAWLLLDLYNEARLMVRMFLDFRYRPSWTARVVPLVMLGLIWTSWLWLPGTSILPTSLMTIIDKSVDLALGFVAFRILSREARRYQEALYDLPSRSSP